MKLWESEWSDWVVFRTGNPDRLERYKEWFGWAWLIRLEFGVYGFHGKEFRYEDGTAGRASWNRDDAKRELIDLRFCNPELAEEVASLPDFRSVPGKQEGIWDFLADAPWCVKTAIIHGRIIGKEADILLFLRNKSGELAKRFTALFLEGKSVFVDGCYHCRACEEQSCNAKLGINCTLNFGYDKAGIKAMRDRQLGKCYEVPIRPARSEVYSRVVVTDRILSSSITFARRVQEETSKQGNPCIPRISKSEMHQKKWKFFQDIVLEMGRAQSKVNGDWEGLRLMRSVLVASADAKLKGSVRNICYSLGISMTETFSAEKGAEGQYDIVFTDEDSRVEQIADKARVCYYRINPTAEHYLSTLSVENILKALSTLKPRSNPELERLIAENGGRTAWNFDNCRLDFKNSRYSRDGLAVYLDAPTECALYQAIANDWSTRNLPLRVRELIRRSGMEKILRD